MKKLMVIAVVVALAVPCLAWSASNYVTSFKPGAYDGTISSVVPAINGKKVTMTLKYEGNNVVATVDFEGSKEVWTWNDKTLTQKEVDPKTGAVAMEYGATAPAGTSGATQKFSVNCKNKATNECDAGIDARNYWVLESAPNTVRYVVYGVPGDQKGNASVQPAKRHEFVFKTK